LRPHLLRPHQAQALAGMGNEPIYLVLKESAECDQLGASTAPVAALGDDHLLSTLHILAEPRSGPKSGGRIMWELGELARGVLKATGLLVVVTIVILLVSYIVSALF
jgi:hypothetical protein